MTDFDVSRRRFQSLLERAGDDDALLAELLVAEILLGIFSAMWILEHTIAWIAVVTGP